MHWAKVKDTARPLNGAGHERFWHSAEMRGALDDPEFTVNDDTLVVAQTFRLLER